MTVVSKEEFYKAIRDKTCSDLFHPSVKTCPEGVFDMLCAVSRGAAKFCLALALVSTQIDI